MLPLPREVTVEAMNISIDRHHPVHTSNDHYLLRQFGFTHQNIEVNTDSVERDMEILNGKGLLRY